VTGTNARSGTVWRLATEAGTNRPLGMLFLGGIRFLFDCGPADEAALGAIAVQPEEIAEYRLVPLPTARDLLRPPIRRRVRAGTRRRRCVYLENGRPVPGIT
jgi:8-oxo-dGTP diphosphatase